MATKSKQAVPMQAVHPGEILREELLERGIKQKEFAEAIGVQATHLNAFIKGKRNLNEDLAIKFEEQLNISYSTWMNLHNRYIYDIKAIESREESEREAYAFEKECDKVVNIKVLYNRLCIASHFCSERVSTLNELFPFGILSSSELGDKVSGFYKRSDKVEIDYRNATTWLILNWLTISKINSQLLYKKGNALEAAKEIAALANNQTITTELINRCLEKYGISYSVVSKLEKTPIDAFSTINSGCPCITVTYRYNDMDKLVFDILHELYHIEYHLSESTPSFISIEGNHYSKDPKEQAANIFAQNMLIPEVVWKEILAVGCKSLDPYKIVKTIASEANKHGISPSIAVSRYKRESNFYNISHYRSPKII